MIEKYDIYYLTDIKELIFYLNNSKQTQNIRICREKTQCATCEKILVNDKWISVEILSIELISNANFIWVSPYKATRRIFLEHYGQIVQENSVKEYVVFETECEKYSGDFFEFNIEPEFDIACLKQTSISNRKIDDKELPFIFEPRLGRINKIQEKNYLVYSISSKTDYSQGLYYDNDLIAKEKKYRQYNKDVTIIVYGEKDDFVLNSLDLYRVLYDKVVYEKNIEEYEFDMNTKYLLIPGIIRMISPFVVKFFVLNGWSEEDGLGIIGPCRDKASTDTVIFGNGKNVKIFFEDCINMSGEEWNNFVMKKAVVGDLCMFNYINVKKIYTDIAEQNNRIGYLEWLRRK